MIIEGDVAGDVGFWSKHLQLTDTNEAVHIRDVRGTLSQDLDGALREMQAVASGSRSRGNFMYQANINPRPGEHLTPEQWAKAVDALEKNLGLEDHQRVVIEHVKDGRPHYHIIWNRVDVDTMRVRDMGGNYYSHERTARQLEQEFGLERAPRVHGEREGERTSQRTDLWEYNRGHKSGESPKAIKAELTGLWNTADSGQAFVAGLDERGYILAKGDRRDFCIIDRAGDEHSLARRLDGVTVRQLRERMSFIDRDNLPTVDRAKEIYAERQAEREHGTNRDRVDLHQEDRPAASEIAPEGARDAATATLAKTADDSAGEQFAEKQRDHGGATERGVIRVFDGMAEMAVKLLDFIVDLFSGLVATPTPKRSAFDRLRDDPAERLAAVKARRRADAALENIAHDLKRGDTVSAADIRSLTRGHLEEIMQKGDAGLLALVKQHEEDRERARDPGRGRER